jgi:hypothetical protein
MTHAWIEWELCGLEMAASYLTKDEGWSCGARTASLEGKVEEAGKVVS